MDKIFFDCHLHLFNIDHIPLSLQIQRVVKILNKILPITNFIPIPIPVSTLSRLLKLMGNKSFDHIINTCDVLELSPTDLIDRLVADLNKVKKIKDYKKILLPQIIDFEVSKPTEKLLNQIVDLKNALTKSQAKLVKNKIFIYPFLGIDPERFENNTQQAAFLNNYLNLDKSKIHFGDFIGIKLYPPLGFQIYPFTEKNEFLYKYCCDHDIPVTCHCCKGGFVNPNYKKPDKDGNKRTHPDNWAKVLEKYPKLRLNLAHFGNLKTGWLKPVIDLVKKYEHVYTDVSYNFDQNKKIKKIIRLVKQDHKKKSGKYSLEDKILFGTDFSVVLFSSDSYYDYVNNSLKMCSSQFFHKISGDNALRFLGRDL
ncbi:MAG: amidohydrolase [Spirochaetes bacterium]|nr:amidohydrolase [Spirochaetota bacterium]